MLKSILNILSAAAANQYPQKAFPLMLWYALVNTQLMNNMLVWCSDEIVVVVGFVV